MKTFIKDNNGRISVLTSTDPDLIVDGSYIEITDHEKLAEIVKNPDHFKTIGEEVVELSSPEKIKKDKDRDDELLGNHKVDDTNKILERLDKVEKQINKK